MILKYWAKQMAETTTNVIADQNQTAHWMGCLTQCLVYKATSTTLKNSFVYYGTSEEEFKAQHNKHTKPFRHHECMMRLSYQNMYRTLKTMVLIAICHGKSMKRLHHTSVVQNVAICVSLKKFPTFVLIHTLY